MNPEEKIHHRDTKDTKKAFVSVLPPPRGGWGVPRRVSLLCVLCVSVAGFSFQETEWAAHRGGPARTGNVDG